MNILVLGGFLGSGKTTFLMKLARYLTEKSTHSGPTKLAIIENEIGSVGIDSNILGSAGLQTRDLFAGCACCSLREELVSTVREIQAELDPQTIIIESTGVGIPENIRKLIQENMDVPVSVVVLVDGSRWFRILPAVGTLARGQLVGCDMVLINKADLLSEEKKAEAMEAMKAETACEKIYLCSSVSPELEDTVLPDIASMLNGD